MRRPRPLTWSDRHALIATIRRLPERPGRVAREIGIVDVGCGSTPGRRQSGAIPPLFPIPLFRSRSIPRRGNGAAVSSAQRHRGTRILGVAYGPACLCPPSHNRLLCSAVVTAAVGHGAGGGGWCRTGGAAPL